MNKTEEKRISIDKDLVELGGYHAYKNYYETQRIEVNGNIYKVKNTNYNDPSGLDALTIQKVKPRTKELTVVFVGTNDKQDVLTDVQLLGDTTPAQLKEANKYFDDMKSKYEKDGYKITSACGNSLGGGSAGYIGIKHPEVKVVTLNPALLPEGQVNSKQKYANITNYFSEYDPLTLSEKAGHLDNRIPGSHYMINNGIPDSSKFVTNHIGYVDGPIENQFYEIGVPGQPGYGKIDIAADDYIATSIFTGESLYGGKSKPIDIKPSDLNTLATALQDDILNEKFTYVKSYLSNSVEIIDDEGRKWTQRISKLQSRFEDDLESAAEGSAYLFKGISRRMNQLIKEIDNLLSLLNTAEITSKLLIQLLSSPPAEIGAYILLQSCKVVEGIFTAAKQQLLLIKPKCNELSNSVNYLLTKLIPDLFKGGSNTFLDAVVGELQAHFQIIFRNQEKVYSQIEDFKNQVQGTSNSFQKRDKLIAHAIANHTSIPAASNSVQHTKNYILEESPYMLLRMGFKELQVQLAYETFTETAGTTLLPILLTLEGLLIGLESILEGLSDTIKGATNVALYGSLPMALISIFTSYDDEIRNAVDNVLKPIDQMASTLNSVRKGVSKIIIYFPNLMTNFKPYMDTSLFENSKFENVNQYDTASVNTLEVVELIFKDIAQQLANNKGKAIDALGEVANNILQNLNKFKSQVALTTINS